MKTKLTDLEICQKLAVIENYKGHEKMSTRGIQGVFNPLVDNDRCFKLMVKHKVDVVHEIYGRNSPLYTCRIYGDPEENPISEASNEDVNRAICLSVIGKYDNERFRDM